jgi:hypothetical protein
MRRAPPVPGTRRPLVEGIRRRDFLNGIKLAAGGAAIGAFSPMRAFASGTGPVYSDSGTDPRMLRSANFPSVFNIAHWMRDNRLTYTTTTVTLAATARDSNSGTFTIQEDNGTYDVIIVGSGMSGMSTAHYLMADNPNLKILMLEANPVPGGNSATDEDDAMPLPAGTGGAYAVAPYAPFLDDLYSGIGIDWERFAIPDPVYAYFFDASTPDVITGTGGWVSDVYGKGIKDMPFSKDVIQELKAAKKLFEDWYKTVGSPTDPADDADPSFDYLAQMTLEAYLLGQGFSQTVVDFYTAYAIDALAGQAHQVNAFTSISFLGAEYNPCFALPGANGGLMRHFLKSLIPGSIAGTGSDDTLWNPILTANLDLSSNAVRLRTTAVALRTDTDSSGASVIYYHDRTFYRAHASAVVIATQAHSAQHLIGHIAGSAQVAAFDEMMTVPVVTANVTLRTAAPIVSSANAYDLYWWGSEFWADAVVNDWVSGDRDNPNRAVTLTFYGGNWSDRSEMPAERLKLLTTSFSTYEDSLRDDLERIFAGEGFEFDRDVTDIGVYRWGHGMTYPAVGVPFGAPVTTTTGHGSKSTTVTRTNAPRHVARAKLGRISIAGQDTESSPALESAFGSGRRVSAEVLDTL